MSKRKPEKRTPDNQAKRTEVPGLVVGRIGQPSRDESTLYGTNLPTRPANSSSAQTALAKTSYDPRPNETIDCWPVSQLS